MERNLRLEERKIEIKSKRLAAITALVQQGITDKDVILAIVDSGKYT
jgi:hypothetical protein